MIILDTTVLSYAVGVEHPLLLYERCPDLGAFDTMLAAVALNRRVAALVSADRAFGSVPELPWVDLGAPSLDDLIGPSSAV